MAAKIKRSELEAQIRLLVAAAPKPVYRSVIADRAFDISVGLEVTTTLTTPVGKVESAEFDPPRGPTAAAMALRS